MTRSGLFPLLLTLALAGCLDRTTGPVIEGEFEANISGQYDEELSGSARFGISEDGGFAITMIPVDPNHLIGIGYPSDERPEPGIYTIGDPESDHFFAFYSRTTVEGIVTFFSYDGQLEITSSTPERMEGWINFLALGELPWEPGTEAEILVDATFTAECGPPARCD